MASTIEDRLPPHNLEAEQGVLAGLIRDNSWLHEVAPILRRSDFYRDSHQLIWDAICGLYAEGSPVDALILSERMGRLGTYDRAGGDDYLCKILDSVPHAANTRYHAEIVREKATMRDLIEANCESLRESYAGQTTAGDALDQSIRRLFAISERGTLSEDVPAARAASDAMALIHARIEGREQGLSFGLPGLDRLVGGALPGQVIVIGGRSSMGKTCLALHMCDHIAVELGKPTLFISLEMGHLDLMVRMIGTRAFVPSDVTRGLRPPTADELEWLDEAACALAKAPLEIDPGPVHTPTAIYAKARRHKHARDVAAIFIDYLQLIDPETVGRESRQEVVAAMSRRIKTMALSLKVPVFLLSQLNRAPDAREDKRPRLSDLRESGAIEQDADVVMLLYRPEYYDPNDRPGLCECIVAKNRNGPTDSVELGFDKATNRFGEYTPAIGPAPAGMNGGHF